MKYTMSALLAMAAFLLSPVVATDVDTEVLLEGPVEIVVGEDPDQFSIGWSDGVCYLPVKGARAGDSVKFELLGHNVYLMDSAEAMENCDFSRGKLLASGGDYEYTITERNVAKRSSLYFACEVGSHCFGEQRLRVDLDASEGPRTEAPVSKFILGTSSKSCQAVRQGEMDPAVASRAMETECSEPEFREPTEAIDRPHYYRSCLGPPITLTPGGVINKSSVLSFPFPTDRRVLLGDRTWEFVQGDPKLGPLDPVEVNQLYIHHIAGSVVLGNGAENIRQVEEDAAFQSPYGVLSGDINDIMIFHLIDLRETGDQWLECLECRCKDGQGTYLGFGGSGSETTETFGDGTGGVACCNNCTDLVGPTVDYRLRYNVTYTELSDLDVPVKPIIYVMADVAPAIDRYVEWDVPSYQNLTKEYKLEGNPMVQVLENVGTLRELFGGLFPGAQYTGTDMMEIHRCAGHLHIAAIGMWLTDALTGEIICYNDVEYGSDPKADVGFIRSISVTNYDPPLKVLADRKMKLVTHYDATVLHTGVMGLLSLYVAEGGKDVGPAEAALTADICAAPSCEVMDILPNGRCNNALEDSMLCAFGGLCDCTVLLSLSDTVGGCGGVYVSDFGNITVSSMCAQHCGCGEDILEDSILEQIEEQTEKLCHYAGEECTRYLSNVYTCSQPWADGFDGFEKAVMKVVAQYGEQMALEGTKLGAQAMHRYDVVKAEDAEVSPCDPKDYPPKSEEIDTNESERANGFHPLYLFPVFVVGVIVGLFVLSKKLRRNKTTPTVLSEGEKAPTVLSDGEKV